MKHKLLKMGLIAPFTLAMFLGTGQVLADENTTDPSSETVSTTRETQPEAPVSADLKDTTLSVAYNQPVSSDESVKFAVWSEDKGQDDLVWYDANTQGKADIDLYSHHSYGVYNIHTYSFKPNQAPRGISALTVTLPEPQIQTEIAALDSNNYAITVKNVPSTIDRIHVPVWSAVNGQDDIKWYNADMISKGTYRVVVPLSEHHFDAGHYDVHVYGHSLVTNGLVGLAVTNGFTTTSSKENAKIAVVDYAENKTKFDVVVSSDSNTKPITAVSIAVWSEDKGQDDLKWYTPQITNNQARVTIDIANHSNTTDKYNVHVYTDYADGTRVGQVLGAYQITKPTSPTPEATVSADLTREGIALDLDSNQVSDFTKVHFAVWSEEKGQDDLKWYQADRQGKALAAYENHSGFGTYHIHTYLESNGRMVGLNAKSISIPSPSVRVNFTKISDTSYDVSVSNVPVYMDSVVVPVWSDASGQDDLKWLATTRQGDGSYKGTILLSDHHNEFGKYSAHVYGKSKIGNAFIGLAVTDGFIATRPDNFKEKDPIIDVVNYDKDGGHIGVRITQTEKAIKLIRVAAWSEEHQANLHWYATNELPSGQATVTVDQSYHNGIKGDYIIHAYVDFEDGTTKGFVVGQYRLERNVKNTGSASQGNYGVVNRVIYLDAGHGGKDPGASYFGQTEKTLNLQMQELVKARLEANGYQVITTRTNDTFVELLDRSKNVNNSNSDLFLSLHFNAGSATSNGIETYYYEYNPNYPSRINQNFHNNTERLNRSALLANAIQEGTVRATNAKNNGVLRNTFAVLRETTAPAVLVELGYMSNKAEFDKINTRVYQEKLADGIVAGINKYYSSI